jgi:membrane associated rhomboid family serine protease
MTIEQYRPQRFNLLPDVVKNILIINGIFFLATVVLRNQGLDLIDTLGLHYFQSEKFRWYQIFTYMFMHGNFGHILFNMFAVWMFGAAIENMWGPKRFLQFYIIAGLGAAITHYTIVYFEMQPAIAFINNYLDDPSYEKLQVLVQSDAFKSFSSQEMVDHYNNFTQSFNELSGVNMSQAMQLSVDYVREFKNDVLNAPVVVGASGAVFGLLLAYGMTFPNSLIYLYFFVPIRAKYFVILYGAIELFSGIANVPGDNVAHFAHLGGLLFGLILILYWRWQDRKRRRNDFFRY